MNKKRIIIGTILVTIFSVLFHSVYDKFPNIFTSLLFPVNESIWEHNKMILLAFFVWTIIERIFNKGSGGVIFKDLMQVIFCIIILDITFTPFYLYVLNTQDNLVITIIWYVISIILSFIVGDKYFNKSDNKTVELNSLIIFLLLGICFAILTYNPLKLPIFYDYQSQSYGISP